MCGITGFVGFNDKNLIKRMTQVISHRGPDDHGYFSDKNIELGNRRLSIIDLSKNGRMPMCNENEDIWITYNGEIYNFQELRKELEEKGHRFKSNTDTEVIIHAYEEYGQNCVKKFNGMFAFAIWDARKGKKQLFLARDRLGVKPLYYTKKGNKFIFGSEIKSILKYKEPKKEINLNALSSYLSLRYTLGNETLLKGIFKVPPASVLTYKNRQIKIETYWNSEHNKINLSEKAVQQRVYNYLKDSVQKRLVSDVPLGVFLSGGVDSSVIVSLMRDLGIEDIKTFSIGFEDERISELRYARKVAEKFSTDHHEYTIKQDSLEKLPEMIWHLEEPIAAASYVPYYFLCKKAREKVTVVLAGEGADELFGGYVHYKNLLLGKKVPDFVKRMLQKEVIKKILEKVPVKLYDKAFDYPVSMGDEGRKRLVDFASSLNDGVKSYSLNASLFSEENKTELSNGFILENSVNILREMMKSNTDVLNKITSFEIKNWLPDRILLQQDKISMASSLEAREPFLDFRFVEFTQSLPPRYKIQKGIGKYILKKAFEKSLSKEILYRKKIGFFVPLENWMDNKENFGYLIDEYLDKKTLAKRNLNCNYVEKLMKHRNKSRFLYSNQLFSLIALEIWQRKFIDS